MTETTQTGLAITGHEEAGLKVGLDLFKDNSAAASALLTQAGSGVRITSYPGVGNMHAQANLVELFWQKSLRGGGTTTLQVEEVVESALFEIQNAVNRTRRDTVTNPLKKRCLYFGNAFSKIEAESTFTVAKILRERSVSTPSYVRSNWGEGQVNAVGNRNLAAFQPVFMADVHDPDGIGPLLLKSKHLYAYDQIPTMSNVRLYLGEMVTITHSPIGRPPTSSVRKFKTWDANVAFRGGFGFPNTLKEHSFIWLMYGVLAIEQEQNWTVVWKDLLTTALWVDFVDDVVARVVAIRKDLTKIQTIKQKLMTIIG